MEFFIAINKKEEVFVPCSWFWSHKVFSSVFVGRGLPKHMFGAVSASEVQGLDAQLRHSFQVVERRQPSSRACS